MSALAADYELGRAGEQRAARELRRAGWWVIPRYESIEEGRAPVLEGPSGRLALPDLEAFHPDDGGHCWVEVKSKSKVVAKRNEQGRLYTGLDVGNLAAYQHVQTLTRARVWLVTYTDQHGALWLQLNDALKMHLDGQSWRDRGSSLVSWPVDVWEATPLPTDLRSPGQAGA